MFKSTNAGHTFGYDVSQSTFEQVANAASTDATALVARPERSALGSYLVTTPEQTLVDLVMRPDLGQMPDTAREAIGAMSAGVDAARTLEIATAQSQAAVRAVGEVLPR